MAILGIDYGQKKIGLALAVSAVAEPFAVIRVKKSEGIFPRLKKIIDEEKVERVVVGVSEGEMAEKSKIFAKKLAEISGLKVDLEDETLTSRDAQALAIKAGISRKRRKKLEDAFSASLILQKYLDTQGF